MRRTQASAQGTPEAVLVPPSPAALLVHAGPSARTGTLLVILLAEASAFALLTASGNIPEIVSTLFRALLTL